MKLLDAVLIGRFCGLETVAECVYNIELHYWDCIPYDKVPQEQEELYRELNEYEKGILKLDWDAIEAEVQKEWDEYAESQERLAEHPPERIDLGDF